MSAFLAVVTILSLSICGPEKTELIEKLELEKPSNSKIEHKTIFKTTVETVVETEVGTTMKTEIETEVEARRN